MVKNQIAQGRFNKPEDELVIDLLNSSNNTYLSYGSVILTDIRSVTPPVNEDDLPLIFNTETTVRLKETDPAGIRMWYRRLDLSEVFSSATLPEFYIDPSLNTGSPAWEEAVSEQIRTVCLIQLDITRCTFTRYFPAEWNDQTDPYRLEISPWPGNKVWIGDLTVWVYPPGHLNTVLNNHDVDGLELEDLRDL